MIILNFYGDKCIMGILKLQKRAFLFGIGLSCISLPVLAYNPDERIKETCSVIVKRGFNLGTNRVGNNAQLIFSRDIEKELCIGRANNDSHRTVVFHGVYNLKRWDGKPLNKQYCLNAYKPKRGSMVNLYKCDANDSEQTWVTSQLPNGLIQIRKDGTNLCLNSYRTSEGSKLNLWTCDVKDSDQSFEINYMGVVSGP